MPSASEAYIHLSSLPRHDQKSLLIKEISNKNYMPDSHRFTQVSPHFFSDKQDMAWHRDSSAYCNSLQQKLWELKTPSVPCAQFSAADCLRAQGVKRESPDPWEASHFQVLHQNSEDCFPTGWALWKEWYSRVLTSPQHCFPPLENQAAQTSVADLSAPFKKQHKEDKYQAISATSLLRSLCLNYWEK